MSVMAELAAASDRAVGLDHNQPPPEPFEAIKAHLEDLLSEAHNWADGTEVETQAQADEAARLIGELREGAKAADDLRVEEKKPHDDAIGGIQAKFNVYIADPKTKNPGKVWKAIDALKACVQPFLVAQEAERRRVADEARKKAEEAAAAAAAAAKAAAPTDLAAQEAAEVLISQASDLAGDARRVETSRTQARGGGRAMGLRATWTPVLTDNREAMLHYMKQRPDAFIQLVKDLAAEDVRAGKRMIPGFDVVEGSTL